MFRLIQYLQWAELRPKKPAKSGFFCVRMFCAPGPAFGGFFVSSSGKPMQALALLGDLPWLVIVLMLLRPRIRIARTVEGKRIRTEFEAAINDPTGPRRPDIR